MQEKQIHGFSTEDIVKATVPCGKKQSNMLEVSLYVKVGHLLFTA